VHQRASGWLVVETSHIQLRTNIGRGAAVRLASEMQRSCAPKGDEDRVQVTVLPVWQFDQSCFVTAPPG
jgi:hypothetical protein